MSHPHLHCHDLTICYHERPAVHHVSAELPCGAFAAIVGPNGAGKSTLLHGILGWLPWTSGSVTVGDEPVAKCLKRLTYLPQRKTQDLDFPVDVETVVAMGRYQHRGLFSGFKPEDHRAIDQAISEMGLQKLRKRPLAQLSGGQQQRAFLARALATGADVLLLDEPLTGLDEPSSRDLLARLRNWAVKDRLVIAVIHDLTAVSSWCTHALLINRDLIACGAVAQVMTSENLAKAYGRSADSVRMEAIR